MSPTISSIIVRMKGLLFFVIAVLLLGMGGAPKDPQISIERPYANLSGMFIGAASVFMRIENTGGPDALLAAAVELPGAVAELHDVKGSRMFKVEKIKVPGREVLQLQPGARHIMVFNLPKQLKEGSEMSLKLMFERSGERQITVRFEKPADMPDGH